MLEEINKRPMWFHGKKQGENRVKLERNDRSKSSEALDYVVSMTLLDYQL